MVVSQEGKGNESMSVNGQDAIETKLSTEDPTPVAGAVDATRVQAVARAGPRSSRRRAQRRDALDNDVWVYRMVVAMLGLVVIIATLGGLVVAMAGKAQVPEMVVALGSGAAGALAGILSPSPPRRR